MNISHKQNWPSASDHIMIFTNIQVCLGKYRCATSNLIWQMRNTIEYLLLTLSPCLDKVQTPVGCWATSWTLIPLHSPRWGQSSWNNRQKDIRSSPKSVSAPCALWVQKGNHGWADMRQCSYPVVPPDFLLAHERWERALVVEKERKGLCRNGHGWERKTHGSGLSFFELGCGEIFEGW